MITINDVRFLVCIDHLFKTEGGYNNIKADRGGATNFGISLKFAKTLGGSYDVDLDNDGDVDSDDMRKLSIDDAKAIYYLFFWKPTKCADIPAPFDGMVFDQTVNGLPTTGIKLLQQTINSVIPDAKLKIDGVYGNITKGAAYDLARNKKAEGIAEFRRYAINRYRNIVATDPSQQKFIKGWINRANRLGTW